MTTQPPSHEEVQRLAVELDNIPQCPMRAGRTLRSLLADNVRLRNDIRSMIEKAAAGSLDGYRELGERAANAENERDQLRARIEELETELRRTQQFSGTCGLSIGGINVFGDEASIKRVKQWMHIADNAPAVRAQLDERIAALEKERAETIVLLRDVCQDVGDNDWPDDLHLADIIEKHLAKHVWSRQKNPVT